MSNLSLPISVSSLVILRWTINYLYFSKLCVRWWQSQSRVQTPVAFSFSNHKPDQKRNDKIKIERKMLLLLWSVETHARNCSWVRVINKFNGSTSSAKCNRIISFCEAGSSSTGERKREEKKVVEMKLCSELEWNALAKRMKMTIKWNGNRYQRIGTVSKPLLFLSSKKKSKKREKNGCAICGFDNVDGWPNDNEKPSHRNLFRVSHAICCHSLSVMAFRLAGIEIPKSLS